MIQVKITKNVMNKSTNVLGINIRPVQIVFAIIAASVGVFTIFKLKDTIEFNSLMWIVFAELAVIIGLGAVRPNGMNLIKYIISVFKTDKRLFNRKGVLDDD